MSTRYFRANPQLGSVSTSMYILIPTSPATQIIANSGAQAMQLYNLGTGNLVWGDSNIAVNSGNYLFPLSRIEWTDIQDAFSVFVRADSVQTLITKTEYGI